MLRNPGFIALAGVLIVVGAIAANLLMDGDGDGAPPPSGKAPQTLAVPSATPGIGPSPAQVPPPRAVGSQHPSFDVVRINPNGDAVIAGRATPGAKVSILDGGAVIGEVTADTRGEWVFLPQKPLEPGNREFSLSAVGPDGTVLTSERSVIFLVPGPEQEAEAVAVTIPKEGDAPPEILNAAPPADGGVQVKAIDQSEKGAMTIAGLGPAKSRIQLYLDNKFLGRADIDEKGRWKLTAPDGVAPGSYTLRADEVDAEGNVITRVILPFSPADKIAELAPGRFFVVQPGQSLWRIARRVYGEGPRYTTIFQANAARIDNPDLIFPGQVFQVPPRPATN